MTWRTARPEWVPFSTSADTSATIGPEPTRGRLEAALCWGLDEESGAVLAPPADSADASDAELLPQSDPNDPSDLNLTATDQVSGGLPAQKFYRD